MMEREASPVTALRLKAGFGQIALASKVGVSPAYLCRIERGRALPGLELVERLANQLQVTEKRYMSAWEEAHEKVPNGPIRRRAPARKRKARRTAKRKP